MCVGGEKVRKGGAREYAQEIGAPGRWFKRVVLQTMCNLAENWNSLDVWEPIRKPCENNTRAVFSCLAV